MKIERPLNFNKHLFEDYSDSIYTKLNEDGYNRIWEHCSNGFFIISACTNEYNESAINKLKRDLRIMGYKFIELKGYYNSNIPDVSFIVPFNSIDDEIDNYAFNDAINLMPRYQQESVLIYDKYSNDTGMYYINKNCKLEYAGEFHKIEDINKYMPLLKRKENDYTYESIGIRTLKGHGSLSPYYQYLREGYIPLSSDFKKLERRRFVNNKKLFEMALIGKCDNDKVEVYTAHSPIHIHWKGCEIDVTDINNILVLDGDLSERELKKKKKWLNEYCSRKNMGKMTNLEAIYAIWDALNPEEV